MTQVLRLIRPSTAIDVGCGSGGWLVRMQKAGVSVLGVDFCEEMLTQAMLHSSLRGRLVLGDAESLPFCAEAADLVLCSMVLGYLRNLPKVFREFTRVATPGAYIAVTDLHPAAISAGWTRSFRSGLTVYEIDHHSYSLDEIEDAACGAGLRNSLRQTVYLGQPEFEIFQRKGRAELLAEVSQTPALFLQTWRKPC